MWGGSGTDIICAGTIAGFAKGLEGLGKLVAKTLTHRSPLLPFVRR